MSAVPDAGQRLRAIEPTGSFCVSAPAGSGKTELLIQRYLGLLARVARPENVLAITFTRKAAAEMRERVLQALQDARHDVPCDSAHLQITRDLALAALDNDTRHEWRLLQDVSRMNIKTIDSFCLSLARQMPILSTFGGRASPQDDALPLYQEAVRDLFGLLEQGHEGAEDLRAILRLFDNNWQQLQDLLIDMLARRNQWRMYVGVHETPDESEQYLVAVVEALVRERLRPLAQRFAPCAAQVQELMAFAAHNLGRPEPGGFPGSEPGDLEAWRDVRTFLMADKGTWRKTVTKTQGFPADKGGEAQQRKQQMLRLLEELATVDALQEELDNVRLLPQVSAGASSWQLVLHLSRLLPLLAAHLLLVFRRRSAVDHGQVAESALLALGEEDAATDLALRLDYRIEHILVDEFQDTSINQYELLQKLTRGWLEHNENNPDNPRTLMIVGDAMQSIYGFRDANVGLFLRAREEGFNGLTLEHLELSSNFRSQAGIIHWVNQTFCGAFPREDDVSASRVRYREAEAIRDALPGPAVSIDAFTGEDAREAEVEFICAHIAQRVAAGETDIAVLGRQRSHLHPIGRGLKALGVSYQAQDLDSLAQSGIAADLLSLCRALANRADRLSWLALLRAPWCGLQLADMLALARYGEDAAQASVLSTLQSEDLPGTLSEDGRQRVRHVIDALARAWKKRDRLGLRAWVEETWLALGGARVAGDTLALEDAESFFRLLELAEAQGRGLDIDWLATRLEQQYMSGGDADCPVQLLTLHKAKGLEFDRVYIPRLNGSPRSDSGDLLLWDEHSDAAGRRAFLLAANDRSNKDAPTLYNYLRNQRKLKGQVEATRLLYVGATRAVQHLHLSAGVIWDERQDGPRAPASSSLLHCIWPQISGTLTVHEAAALVAQDSAGPVPLVRLARAHLPAVVAVPAQDNENLPERPDNHFDRVVGTVVHLALEALSQRAELPVEATAQELARWRVALQREGLWGDALDAAMAALSHSLDTTLAGETGRWILDSGHPEAHSEWALSMAGAAGVQDIVIDRTFIDAATGQRWVVDYKTSRPAQGESRAAFFARETAHYATQLATYRHALRQLGTPAVRCALFFTALGCLHELDEDTLAAGEG